jgi:hypothetical protein
MMRAPERMTSLCAAPVLRRWLSTPPPPPVGPEIGPEIDMARVEMLAGLKPGKPFQEHTILIDVREEHEFNDVGSVRKLSF